MHNWHDEIFAYFDQPVTNAYTESANNLIRARLGRSYSFEVLRATVSDLSKNAVTRGRPKNWKRPVMGPNRLRLSCKTGWCIVCSRECPLTRSGAMPLQSALWVSALQGSSPC